MNKVLVASGISLALLGGAFAANNYMIEKVGQEIPIQALNALESIDPQLLQVQRVSSQVNGKEIKEEYSFYFIIDGKRQQKLPLLVTHNAKIGLFGSNVNGTLSLPKDKGLAAEFIKEATTFNENITYTFSTTTQKLDLNADIQLGAIQSRRETINIGKLSVNLIADSKEQVLKANLPTISLGDNFFALNMKGINLTLLDNIEANNSSIDFNLGDLNFQNTRSKEGVRLSDSNLTINLVENETGANFSTNIDIQKVSLQAKQFATPDLSFNFKTAIEGIQLELLEELGDLSLHSKNNNSNKQQQEIIQQLFEAGINAKELSLSINESSINGNIQLKPANYNNIPKYEVDDAVIRNIYSQIDIIVDPNTIANISPLKSVVDRYFNAEPNGNFSASFELSNGQPMLNGMPL
ncbi:hypothetical protein [Aliivibrio logei]|uniref:DUF945 domain-containing protein n=1 Tax=Aliivibrio logei TaxID=688 RepID=A0A1B9NZV4_ALILO|nr:hypothetical protein [Aliivibrio logei]OCH21628.1 hypothetical protein A6E04_07110 [Aliivibrio logei]